MVSENRQNRNKIGIIINQVTPLPPQDIALMYYNRGNKIWFPTEMSDLNKEGTVCFGGMWEYWGAVKIYQNTEHRADFAHHNNVWLYLIAKNWRAARSLNFHTAEHNMFVLKYSHCYSNWLWEWVEECINILYVIHLFSLRIYIEMLHVAMWFLKLPLHLHVWMQEGF